MRGVCLFFPWIERDTDETWYVLLEGSNRVIIDSLHVTRFYFSGSLSGEYTRLSSMTYKNPADIDLSVCHFLWKHCILRSRYGWSRVPPMTRSFYFCQISHYRDPFHPPDPPRQPMARIRSPQRSQKYFLIFSFSSLQ